MPYAATIDVTGFTDYNGIAQAADNAGFHDATLIIQKAIDTAYYNAYKYGGPGASAAVHIPAGLYRIDGTSVSTPAVTTLSVPSSSNPYTPTQLSGIRLSIFGDGNSATILTWQPPTTAAGNSQHLFDVSLMGVSFRYMTIESNVTSGGSSPTVNLPFVEANTTDSMASYNAGAAIHLTGPGNYHISDMVIGSVYSGIHVDSPSASQIWISNVNITLWFVYGILFRTCGGNVFISKCQISSGFNDSNYQYCVGIRINQGDGYQVSDCIIALCGQNCLQILPWSSADLLPQPVQSGPTAYIAADNLYFSNNQFDTCQYGSAVRVDGSVISQGTSPAPASNAYIAFLYFTNCTATSASNIGFYFTECIRVGLTNCAAFANASHGVFADYGVAFLNITGGQYFQNSFGGTTPQFDGIYIRDGVSDFQIIGANCGGAGVHGSVGATSNQRFGITVGSNQGNDGAGAGTSDRYTITDCDVSGYTYTSGTHTLVTYGINDRGNGYQKSVAQNRGYNPIGVPLAEYGPAATAGGTAPGFAFAISPPMVPTTSGGGIVYNPYGVDAWVYVSDPGSVITNLSVGNVTSFNNPNTYSPNYDPVAIPPGSFTYPIRVPARAIFGLAYSGTPTQFPTWRWVLE